MEDCDRAAIGERIARLESGVESFHKLVDTKFLERDKAVTAELRERDKALSLHERELGQHLERLNHAHADAVAKESSFVARPLFDVERDRLNDRVAEVRNDFSKFQSRIIGITIGATSVAAICGGLIVGLILRIYSGK
jgi:hypothetical protein